jgi:hypothetical protein
MSIGRSLGLVLLAGAAAALLGAGEAQDPLGTPKKKVDQEAREKKAQTLWDQSEQLEKDGKFLEAQQKLRELRSRYRSTIFYFDKMETISERINTIGFKLAVGALQKTSPYKKPHQDSWFGYEFAPPDGWKGVPPMSLWFNEMDNDETYIKGQVERVARYNAPYLDKMYMSVYKVYACNSIDILEMRVTGFLSERLYKGLKAEAVQPWPGRNQAVRKTYSTPDGDRLVIYYFVGEHRGLALAGCWRAGGEDNFFIQITTIGPDGTSTVRKSSSDKPVEPSDFAHALKVFDACARTFWIYDAATRQGKTVQLNRSALCSDWNVMRSPRGSYLIEYGTSTEYAKRCADELEQIFALYRQVIPCQKGIPQCRVRIFDREDDFIQYSGHPGAAAYWSPGHEEIVCYKFEGDKMKLDSREEIVLEETRPPEEITFKVLYHECFHQYMYYLMGRGRGVDFPSWLGEGLGDYFFGGEWQKNPRKFQIGINEWRVKRIQDAVKKDQHVALDKIVRYDQMGYYSNASLCYAEGWALMYFLLTSPAAKAKGWSRLPMAMIDALKSSGDAEKATNKVFQGVDLKAMEEEWKKFVLAIPLPKNLQDRGDGGGGP